MKVKDKFDAMLEFIEEKDCSEFIMDLLVLQVLRTISVENLGEIIGSKVINFIDNLKEEIGNQEVKE